MGAAMIICPPVASQVSEESALMDCVLVRSDAASDHHVWCDCEMEPVQDNRQLCFSNAFLPFAWHWLPGDVFATAYH